MPAAKPKTITVAVTQEDIDAGFEAVVRAGSRSHPERLCPLARALSRETLRAAGVMAGSWHQVPAEGKPHTPGVALPPDAIAWVKGFDEAVEDERSVRHRTAFGERGVERRVATPGTAVFTVAVPS